MTQAIIEFEFHILTRVELLPAPDRVIEDRTPCCARTFGPLEAMHR